MLTGAYQPTADITLYALYSRTVSGSGSTGYARFTGSSIENGDYVIVSAATGSALTASVANNWLKAGSTYSGDSIASPDAADVWTITNGVISAKNGNGSIYSSAAKKIALSSTDSTVWSFTNNGDDWTIANDTVGQLSYNSFWRLASVFRRLRLGQDLRPVPRGRGLHNLLHDQPDRFRRLADG